MCSGDADFGCVLTQAFQTVSAEVRPGCPQGRGESCGLNLCSTLNELQEGVLQFHLFRHALACPQGSHGSCAPRAHNRALNRAHKGYQDSGAPRANRANRAHRAPHRAPHRAHMAYVLPGHAHRAPRAPRPPRRAHRAHRAPYRAHRDPNKRKR